MFTFKMYVTISETWRATPTTFIIVPSHCAKELKKVRFPLRTRITLFCYTHNVYMIHSISLSFVLHYWLPHYLIQYLASSLQFSIQGSIIKMYSRFVIKWNYLMPIMYSTNKPSTKKNLDLFHIDGVWWRNNRHHIEKSVDLRASKFKKTTKGKKLFLIVFRNRFKNDVVKSNDNKNVLAST